MIGTSLDTLDVLLNLWHVRRDGQLPYRVNASRNYLPTLTRQLRFTKGAEIGVWRGEFSAFFCAANSDLHMLCVDPWEPSADWTDAKNVSASFIEEAYQDAQRRLSGCHATIVRQRSEQAVQDVPDRSLDLVYIDGNHALESVTSDLELWAPKVKSGGLLCGHDFRQFDNKPYIHVVEAVTAYTKAHGIDPWFVLAADRTPSFLWVVS